jgi:hypothetical protein
MGNTQSVERVMYIKSPDLSADCAQVCWQSPERARHFTRSLRGRTGRVDWRSMRYTFEDCTAMQV